MRSRLLLALTAAGLLAATPACGGGSSEPEQAAVPAATAIPTATPYVVEPEPTIVAAAVATQGPAADVTYIVEPGDTLSELAVRFETTVAALMAHNGLDDSTIFVGQELLIPSASSDTASDGDETPPADAASDDASVYVVQAGDTAWAIASSFGATVEELAEANGMTVDELVTLHVGDELNLPRPR